MAGDIFSDRRMANLPPVEQALRAIDHVLLRIRHDATLAYYLGLGTESFARLTEAYAALTGHPVEAVRRNCAGQPQDPVAAALAWRPVDDKARNGEAILGVLDGHVSWDATPVVVRWRDSVDGFPWVASGDTFPADRITHYREIGPMPDVEEQP